MRKMFGRSSARGVKTGGGHGAASLLNRISSFLRLGVPRRGAQDQRGCLIECELQISDDDYRVPGYLLKLSTNGALFRPESAFLMKRNHETAKLTMDDRSVETLIDASTSAGYRLHFPTPIATPELREWMTMSRREEA